MRFSAFQPSNTLLYCSVQTLFKAQDDFIAANATTTMQGKQDVFYDASTSGVTYYDDTGTVIHDYVPMTYSETMVAKLSSAPNRVRKLFPDLEKLKPFLVGRRLIKSRLC